MPMGAPVMPPWANDYEFAHLWAKRVPMNLIWSGSAQWLLSCRIHKISKTPIMPMGMPFQTPGVYHCHQITLWSRERPKSQMHRNNPQMRNLFCNNVENRTIQIHQSCVIICHIQLNNCVFLQQSSAADVHWQYFSFVFGISQSSHAS